MALKGLNNIQTPGMYINSLPKAVQVEITFDNGLIHYLEEEEAQQFIDYVEQLRRDLVSHGHTLLQKPFTWKQKVKVIEEGINKNGRSYEDILERYRCADSSETARVAESLADKLAKNIKLLHNIETQHVPKDIQLPKTLSKDMKRYVISEGDSDKVRKHLEDQGFIMKKDGYGIIYFEGSAIPAYPIGASLKEYIPKP